MLLTFLILAFMAVVIVLDAALFCVRVLILKKRPHYLNEAQKQRVLDEIATVKAWSLLVCMSLLIVLVVLTKWMHRKPKKSPIHNQK